MDKKFYGLLFIFVFCILLLPSVGASEIDKNGTDLNELSSDVVYSDNIESDEILSDDIKEVYFNASVEKDGDGSLNNPYKYLRSNRLNKINVAHFADGTYRLDSYRGIYSDLELIGQSAENTIIRYDGMAFSIGIDSSLTATNITFLKASIRNFGVFVANDCIFNDCVAAYVDTYGNSFGGAVYCKSGGISSTSSPGAFFTNCTFLNNYANYGGAVYVEIGVLSFTECNFTNNSAKGYGGAVASEDGTTLMVYDSVFDSDRSLDDVGGAIYGKTSSMIVRNSDFINCQSQFGGAVCNLRGQLEVSSSRLRNNSAKYDGGAVYSMYGRVNILNNDFESNCALNGGAIFIDNCTRITINSNDFTSNAAAAGGAVYSNANPKITNSSNTFKDNIAVLDDDFHVQDNYPVVVNGNGNYVIVGNYTDWTEEIPSYYNMFDEGLVTPVRDQQAGGNCWGFASIAALESCILKAVNMSTDFSEENIKNLVEIYSAYGWMRETNEGGYDAMSFAYLVSWIGPIYEELDIYDDYSTLSPVLDSAVHVQDIIYAPKRSSYTDNDAIKEMMLKYGAISAAYGHSSDYYNPDTYSYYYPDEGYANHAIAVIGWDDDFSASNFLDTPPGDGAWIIKNSWNDTWGKDGVFYISYYDAILFKVGYTQQAFTFVFNNSCNFTKNYQYDYAGLTDYLITGRPSMWYSTEFNSTGRDYISAFGTYFDIDTDYEAYVYVNGELKLTQKGSSIPGYHTINLEELIPVNVGDSFKVALKITTSHYANVPICENVMSTRTYYKPGVSYVSYNGKTWIDLSNYTFGYGTHSYTSQVACLKVYTTDMPDSATAITLNDTRSFVGDIVNVTAEVRDEDNNLLNYGSVNFTLSNQSYVVDVVNGLANLLLTFDSSGIYDVSAVFSALKYYLPSNATAVIDVSKLTPEISLTIDDAVYGNCLSVNISLSDDLDNLTLTIGSDVFNVNETSFIIPKVYDAGDYEAVLNYPGSEKYCNATCEDSFRILPANIAMEVSIKNITDSVNITVTFNESVDDNVSITVGNETYDVSINNSIAALTLTDLKNGIYDVIVNFTNRNYEDKSFKSSFEINQNEIQILAPDVTKYYRGEERFVVTVTDSRGNPLANRTAGITINGVTYNRTTDSNGTASIALGLPSSTYNVTVTVENQTAYSVVTILSTVNGTDITKVFRNGTQYFATFRDSEGKYLKNGTTVRFNINGVMYERKVSGERGLARLNINLEQGEYIITAMNPVTGENAANNITVIPRIVENRDVTKYYRNATQYTVKVIGDDDKAVGKGVTVRFNINGVFYERTTDESGIAKLNINLQPGDYIITAEYEGCRVSNNITVLPVLHADNLTKKYGTPDQFVATLVDGQGKPFAGETVTFNIHGVFYYKTTDANGQAKLNINLMPGEYIITSSYDNSNIANKITII